MPKTAVISARIDPHLKKSAEHIFKELGLTTTQAITLFYKQVELQRGLPFSIKIPSADAKTEYEDWLRLSASKLAAAYGENEPDYSQRMIREPNPEYEGK